MNILWFTNIIFPEIGKELGKVIPYSGGWMHQFKKKITANQSNKLGIANFEYGDFNIIEKEINNTTYFVLPRKVKKIEIYDNTIEEQIEKLIKIFQPNLVHIWGTEYPHCLSIAKICKKEKIKFVVSIQGIISDIARHYVHGLPHKTIYSYTIRDFLRNDNIYMQKNKFQKRGIYERECLKITNYVIGRTTYDYAGIKEINSNIKYFFCNECLRDCFYTSEKWEAHNIKKHSIFISQAYYPIKGFHLFLEAISIVKQIYCDVRIYVAGGYNPMLLGFKSKLKMSSYGNYLSKLIKKYDLNDNIIFLKSLTAEEMKNQLLSSNLFVSPSLVENSPNSVGEAMILGVPTISSFVGGVPDMIEHKISGLLYPVDQPNILAHYIIKIFEEQEYANELSQNAIKKAKEIYNIEKNTEELINIYKKINKSI